MLLDGRIWSFCDDTALFLQGSTHRALGQGLRCRVLTIFFRIAVYWDLRHYSKLALALNLATLPAIPMVDKLSVCF